jgi:hypothetical protein
MSRKLLEYLNGSSTGDFNAWLKTHPWEPVVAWYPSSGRDFKDLLFLHKSKYQFEGMTDSPELFIHTDCSIQISDFERSNPLEICLNGICFKDESTTIYVLSKEELPSVDISGEACDKGLSQFPASPDYGRIFFLRLHIESDSLGSVLQSVLFAVAENGAFASQILIPNNARIKYIWEGNAGGKPNDWIRHVIKRLQTEYVVRENRGAGARDSSLYSDGQFDFQVKEYLAVFQNLEAHTEDLFDAAQWTLATPRQGISTKTNFRWYIQKKSNRIRDNSTFERLSQMSSNWEYFESILGLTSVKFSRRRGICSLHFSGLPECTYHCYFARKQEIANELVIELLRLSGRDYRDYYLLGGRDGLIWKERRDFASCTSAGLLWEHAIYELKLSKQNNRYFFSVNFSFSPYQSVEKLFWRVESALAVVKNIVGDEVQARLDLFSIKPVEDIDF